MANYPVIPDEDPPKQLFLPELQSKCVALSIQAQRLNAVRSARMTLENRWKMDRNTMKWLRNA